jgi:polar amino acid transport system substrate-binding protein
MYRMNIPARQYFSRFAKTLLTLVMCMVVSLAFRTPLVMAEDASKIITVVYDNWPPSTIEPTKDDPRRGFANDLIKGIFTKAGYDVRFKAVPLNRGHDMVRSGKAQLYSETSEIHAPDLKFPEMPTYAYDYVFWVLSDDNWTYDGLESLKGRRAGSVIGYEFEALDKDFNAYMKDSNSKLFETGGTDAVERLFQMLALGRIEMFCESFLVGQNMLAKLGLTDKIKAAGVLKKPFVGYPGFSPVDPRTPELLRIWDKSRKELQDSGDDLQFLKSYGIKQKTFLVKG